MDIYKLIFLFNVFFIGFQSQVEKSSESAKLALATVPGIEKQIEDAQSTIEQAENVSKKRVNLI